MINDIALAFRRLRAAPAFTAFSILTLGLGIGATAAVYSVVYTALLKPGLDIRNLASVVNIYHIDPTRGGSGPMIWLSWPDYQDLRAMQTVFSEVTAWARFRSALVGGSSGEIVMGEVVTGEYFPLLGVEPALGRLLSPSDDRPDATPVIVLSDSLWRRHFAADPAVVGRTVQVAAHTFEVIGVTPPSFRGVDMPSVMPTAAWIPMSASTLVNESGRNVASTRRDERWVLVKGRLKPGRTLEDARTQIAGIGARLDLSYPLSSRFRMPYAVSRRWFVMPASELRMHESVHFVAGRLAAVTLGAVALVLLVACTNLANLLLARGTPRWQELAIRLALGASRWRLVREQIVECTLVAAAGSLTAFVVARVSMAMLLTGAMQIGPGLTIQFSPEFHSSVIVVGVLATTLALLVFGVIPALHLTRGDLRNRLFGDSGAGSLPRWPGRRYLIVGQVAVSAALVTIAALCVQQIAAVAARDSGLDLDRLAIVRLDFSLQRYEEPRARATLDTILSAVGRQPGVESSAISSGLPVGTGTRGAMVTKLGSSFSNVNVPQELLASTSEIFRTLGVRLVSGRRFDDRDTSTAAPVAIIDESTAKRLFGTANVIGRDVQVQRLKWAGEDAQPAETRTIVGVTADTDTGTIGRRDRGVVYLPFSQHYEPQITIVVRTPGDPAALIGPMKTLLARLDPGLAIFDAGTGHVLGGVQNLPLEIAAGVSGVLGGLALLLAMAGLYGVLSELVAQRTREMGLRMALGADRGRLMRMVLRDGVDPVALGLIAGVGLGALIRTGLRPLFFRVLPTFDLSIVISVAGFFIAATVLACYFPARRAASVDPNEALRHL